MRRIELGLVLLVVALALGVLLSRRGEASPPSPYCRAGPALAGVYHPARLHVRRACVVATGIVTKVKFEEYDGDVHIAVRPDDLRLLSDGNDKVGGALVVEIIPQDRGVVPIPEPGARVTVVGPWVDDTEHGWREVHPAWWISSGRLLPASTRELTRVESLLDDKEER